MRKLLFTLLMLCVLSALAPVFAESDDAAVIKVLILPKFEVGDMTGDFPGEAQYYYETYCIGGEEYEIADIFATAMKNNFSVGSVIIDAIVNGTL